LAGATPAKASGNHELNEVQRFDANVREISLGNKKLDKVSIDKLWNLHEKLGGILSANLEIGKRELEHRLARLQGRIESTANTRRPYAKRLGARIL
jgi:hypothetical protein